MAPVRLNVPDGARMGAVDDVAVGEAGAALDTVDVAAGVSVGVASEMPGVVGEA
jgi:hypothetical protein